MGRRTIGNSPLKARLSEATTPQKREKQPKSEKKKVLPDTFSERAKKVRLTVEVDEDLLHRAKNAVFWTRGLTLAGMVSSGIEREVSSLEKAQEVYGDEGKQIKGKGEVFPDRPGHLQTGRPVDSR